MITKAQQVMLDALKASLFGSTPSFPEDTDWDEVIKEAKAQTVLGVISPVIPVKDESVNQGTAHYMRILYEQDRLIKLLDDNNIPCVVLKGCASAIYYPKPYLRTMGDVDLLVPRDRFEEALQVVEANGCYNIQGKDENGVLVKNVRHVSYLINGIEFEIHHHFSSLGFDIDDILEAAIERREYHNLSGYRVPVLPAVENGLVLIGHVHQHLRKNELGLRQIVDWGMFYYSIMDKPIWTEEFEPLADKVGFKKISHAIIKLCEEYLDLPETVKRNDISEEVMCDLMSIVLSDGNFGRKRSESKQNPKELLFNSFSGIRRNGACYFFQKVGLRTWKACKKHPRLQSFAFVYGFFRCLGKGINAMFKTRGGKGIIKEGLTRDALYKEIGVRIK